MGPPPPVVMYCTYICICVYKLLRIWYHWGGAGRERRKEHTHAHDHCVYMCVCVFVCLCVCGCGNLSRVVV